ncbi:uncharacterized protein LOC127278454 [Leptopilina boulardi]|uniref:uncharacterized protein LOC127278454 n=1 Tax=Leptopilina boulardi TaxID=63433 RepID=UPI0021F649B2|nr:uncharacterized protein LOC127278454 [Leptopilina boulardi]
MLVYRPEDAFGMNLVIFKFFGLWPSVIKNRTLRFFYTIYGYSVQLFYVLGILPTQFINIYLMRNDLEKLIDSFFFTLTCVGYITKLIVFLLRRKEIDNFFTRLHQPIFAPKRKEDLTVLKDFILSARVSTLIYVSLTVLTVGSWILFPLIEGKEDKVLLFAAWYPYNATVEPAYGYTYALQTILLLTTASMNSQIDMLTANLYVLMVAQLELLKQDFRELATIVQKNNNIDQNYQFSQITKFINEDVHFDKQEIMENTEIYNDEKIEKFQTKSIKDSNYSDEEKLDKILNDRVIKCTQRYQAIVKFVNDVTDLFQIGVVAQICASSIIICATSYEMTSISPTTLQFYVVLQYQLCMLFQIFIYLYRGNDITVKTTELKDAVYECAWMSIPNSKFRKSLCIIMSPLQVPMKLSVGKFFVLSVDTFFGEKTLLFPAWYPYNATVNPAYEYTYVCQTLLLLTTATMNSMIDMLTLNFYVIMVGHMETLKLDFKELTDFFTGNDIKNVDINFENGVVNNENLTHIDLSNFVNLKGTISYDIYLKATNSRDDVFDYINSLEKILNNRIIKCTLRYQAIYKFFHNLYGYAIHFFYIAILLPAQFMSIYIMRNNVQELVDSSFFTLSCIAYASKFIVFISRRKTVEEFFQRLHDPIFIPRRKEHFDLLEESADTARTTSMTLLSIAMTTCITWIIFPLVENKEEKTLLFVAWYPYNTTINPAYGYTYLSQTLLLLTTAAMDTMIDMMTTNFFILMVGQIEILKLDFRELTDFVVINHSEITTNGWSNENSVKFVSDVTNLFQIGIVVQVCVSSVVICTTSYVITTVKTLLYAAWYPYNATVNPAYAFTYISQTILLLTTAAMNSMIDIMTTNFYVVMVGQMEILKQDFRELTDFVAKKELLLASWYPYNTSVNPMFAYTYSSQAFLLINTACVNSMMDTMITNFYILMVGQIEILKMDFKQVADIADKSGELFLKKVETKQLSNSKETMSCQNYLQTFNNQESLDRLLNKRIIKCTEHYREIINYQSFEILLCNNKIYRHRQNYNPLWKKIVSSEMEIYRPEDAFSMNLQTFKLFGVWPSAAKHPVLRLLYNVYGYSFQLFYIVVLLPTQFINIYLTRNDVQKIVDSSFFTLTCVGYVAKLVVFISRRNKVEEFFQRLHHPLFTPKRKEHFEVLKDYTNVAKASSMTFMVLSMITCASWILFPLVDSSQNKVLLFAAWYPFNVTENPTYGYIYASQILLLLTTASMDSMIDMMTTNFFVMLVAQLEILRRDFKHLTDIVDVQDNNNNNRNNLSDLSCEFPNGTVTSDKKLPSNHESGISNLTLIRRSYLQATNSPEDTFSSNQDYLEKTLNERIAKCTLHYEAILDFVNDVRDLFQFGIVIQLCASSIIICVTCFEMTVISPNTMQFYVMIQYCMCMTFQIFIYTWRANDITMKTDELREAVYECAWPSISSKKFRKSLCIIMSRMQIPVRLYVGYFFLLSVDTFFKIIKLAYSFFIILKQVQVKKEE